jgi:hypothetical protein
MATYQISKPCFRIDIVILDSLAILLLMTVVLIFQTNRKIVSRVYESLQRISHVRSQSPVLAMDSMAGALSRQE